MELAYIRLRQSYNVLQLVIELVIFLKLFNLKKKTHAKTLKFFRLLESVLFNTLIAGNFSSCSSKYNGKNSILLRFM